MTAAWRGNTDAKGQRLSVSQLGPGVSPSLSRVMNAHLSLDSQSTVDCEHGSPWIEPAPAVHDPTPRCKASSSAVDSPSRTTHHAPRTHILCEPETRRPSDNAASGRRRGRRAACREGSLEIRLAGEGGGFLAKAVGAGHREAPSGWAFQSQTFCSSNLIVGWLRGAFPKSDQGWW